VKRRAGWKHKTQVPELGSKRGENGREIGGWCEAVVLEERGDAWMTVAAGKKARLA
jgi:hypothetical protein